jgi:hypothetical protein
LSHANAPRADLMKSVVPYVIVGAVLLPEPPSREDEAH